MQWGPLLPQGGGMIQVNNGGHLPIPPKPPKSISNVSLFISAFTIFSNFSSHELLEQF